MAPMDSPLLKAPAGVLAKKCAWSDFCSGPVCLEQVTISLLDKAMADSGKDRFLIDGFPRNEENRSAFEKQVRSGFRFRVQGLSFSVDMPAVSGLPCMCMRTVASGGTVPAQSWGLCADVHPAKLHPVLRLPRGRHDPAPHGPQ